MNDLPNENMTMAEEIFEQLLQQKTFLHEVSATPLRKLKRNLKIGIAYALVISMLYGVLIYMFPLWQVQLGLIVVTAFNVWIAYHSYQLVKKINAYDPSRNVLVTLRTVYSGFKEWFRQQYRMAALVYPVAAAAGYMLGGTIGSGLSIEEFFAKPFVGWALLGVIIVLVPLGLLLAKWMNRRAYGRYVDQLRETITALEDDDDETLINDQHANLSGSS